MMASRILSLFALCLVAALAALWVTPKAALRTFAWQQPAALKPDLSGPGTADSAWMQAPPSPISAYLAIVDRPLFAPDRRPPEPIVPDAPPPAPVPDALNNVHLYGLFTGKGAAAGALMGIEGKTRRVKVTETVGDWTLSEVREREAIFTRNTETRAIPLVPYKVNEKPSATAAAVNPGQPAAAGQLQSAVDMVAAENARREEAKRENIRKRNIVRASAGLPPVND